jgi:hypothetical protein
MEHFNQKNNFESDIDENLRGSKVLDAIAGTKTLKGTLKTAFKDMEVAIGLNKNPIMLGNKPLKTADEIFTALKDGTLTNAKELGRIEKGLLKSSNTEKVLRDSIALNFAKDKNVLKELAKNNRNTTAEIKQYLSSKGYPKSSVDEIVKQMKTNGAIDAKGLLVKDAGNVANTAGKAASKKFGTRIKELLNNIKIKKMSWKQLLAWGAGIGIGGAALWYLVKDNSDVTPEGTPTVPPSEQNDWGPCLNDLLALKEARMAKSPKGEISVFTAPSNKYPGGLNFYSNGRVMNSQTKEMGTWSCTAGEAQVNENMSKNKLNESIGQIVKRVLNERYVMEQSASQIDSDVEDLIDYLDVPVWGNDYKNITALLKKYASNGKFNELKEVYEEAGFMETSLRSDISSIYAIDASSVRAKKELLALLDQIESGKYVQAPSTSTTVPSKTTTTNTNTGQRKPQKTVINEDNKLDIVWDKDKGKAGGDGGNSGGGNSGGGGGGSTATKKYYDCTSVNLDTAALTYGCKDKRVAEVQKCLGITADGKFGPGTRKALIDNAYDASKGITKAIYEKVLKGCKKGEVASTTGTTGNSLADVSYLRNPIKMDLGQVPQMPKKQSGAADSQGMTDAAYYQSLVDNGLIERNAIGRIVYKGKVLEPADKAKLDAQMDRLGYVESRIAATDEGARYVWKRA